MSIIVKVDSYDNTEDPQDYRINMSRLKFGVI